MSKEPNIDQLFKESFSSFNPKVNSGLWSNISKQIPGANSSVAASISKAAFWKLFTGAFVCVLAGVSFVLIYQEFSETNNFVKQDSPINKTFLFSDSADMQIPLIQSFPETAPFDTNDPIINTPIDKVDHYKVELIEDIINDKVDSNHYKQPNSVVNLFLTPRTRRLNSEFSTISVVNDQVKTKELKVEISKQEKLKPIINASVSGGHAPLVVVFEQSEQAEEVLWDFGDGIISEGPIVEHIFRDPGEFFVSVTISNNGFKAHAYKSIKVNSRCIIQKIPNVFTPNGDGENDLFFVKAENIQTFFIQIFNLKGKVVFESDYLEAKWDGNDAFGLPMEQGQYLYFIKAIGNDESDLSRTGSVLIKR